MAQVFLHGQLGRIYGKRFDLAVQSVAEAVKLLNANFKGFNAALLKHQHGFFVKVDGQDVVDMADAQRTAICPEIHITPAVSGAGGNKNGIGQIVMAVILIAAAYSGYFSPSTSGTLFSAGVNMAVSGVATLLFSSTANKVSGDEMTGEYNLTSYAFNGPVNTTAQGNPVPIIYGRVRVGSQVISAGIKVS